MATSFATPTASFTPQTFEQFLGQFGKTSLKGIKPKKLAKYTAAYEAYLAGQQEGRSKELYGMALPWLKKAGAFYEDLASGDPEKLFRSIAPGAESIIGQTEAVKENIIAGAPRGGEQRLALEMADVGKAGQIGNLVTRSYLASFPALATLAQGGIGFSINEIANAIAAAGQGGQIATNVMDAEAAGKGSTLGFLGDLTKTIGGLAAPFFGGGGTAGCWVARAVYGNGDWRPDFIWQAWTKQWANESRAWRIALGLYLIFGEPLGWIVRKTKVLRPLLRPIFDRMVEKARATHGHYGRRTGQVAFQRAD